MSDDDNVSYVPRQKRTIKEVQTAVQNFCQAQFGLDYGIVTLIADPADPASRATVSNVPRHCEIVMCCEHAAHTALVLAAG